MKTILTSSFWLPVLLLLFFSCEKEATAMLYPSGKTVLPDAFDTAGIASLSYSDEPGGGSVSDCQEPTCQHVIEELRLAYLPLANSFCDTLWFDVTCCMDGDTVYALVYVAPDDPRCLPQPWPLPMKW